MFLLIEFNHIIFYLFCMSVGCEAEINNRHVSLIWDESRLINRFVKMITQLRYQ